jgi:hypothetical protein
MGSTICPKHGTQGILSRIEENIAEKMRGDIYIPQDEITIIEVDYYDETDQKLFFNVSFLLYRKTLLENGFKNRYFIYSDDEELKWIKPIQDISVKGAICFQCFLDYLEKHQWNIVFPTPGRGKMSE